MKEMLNIAVVGSGPNGLTAANRVASAGHRVTVFESHVSPGGAARTEAVFGEGSKIDVGAAAHPFGVQSPAFRELELKNWGVEWIHPPYALAHPFEDSEAAFLRLGVEETSAHLGSDAKRWSLLHQGVSNNLNNVLVDVLSPMTTLPRHPLSLMRLGAPGALSASFIAKNFLNTSKAKALFAGSALHSMMPLEAPLTGAFGILFSSMGMTSGWPVARGGTQSIIEALEARLIFHGGQIICGREITDSRQVENFDAVIYDVLPRDIVKIAGIDLSPNYRKKLHRWKPGIGVSKVDFLLDSSIKWADPRVKEAGTVHIGGRLNELEYAEKSVHSGIMPERPYVMVCQQNEVDPTRLQNRSGRVVWSYAHVPFGYNADVQELVVDQIERFAPGFKNQILSMHITKPQHLAEANQNLYGGDISGGALTGLQQVFRPSISSHPYRCNLKGSYICSSATPPGAGVHGMNGWHAAGQLLLDNM